MKKILYLPVLFLSACAGGEGREVSRVSDGGHPVGMTYQQFRTQDMNDGADSLAVQKRFLVLDRDNNGVLSSSEFSD